MGQIVNYLYYLVMLVLFALSYALIHYFHFDQAMSVFFIYGTAFFSCFALFLLTNAGKLFKKQAREAQDEAYKVVWPSFDDVLRTGIMVSIAVTVVGLMLFGLDSLLMNVYNLVL